MTRRGWMLATAVLFLAVLALSAAAPFMAPYGTFVHLDGNPGYIEHGWPGHGLAGLMYMVGDLFCHQEMARSFVLNGSQMPFCIRDTGILVGITVGFAACWVLDMRLKDRGFAYLGIALLLIMAAEWCAEWVLGDMPWPRFVSGMIGGVGAGLFLGWFAYREEPGPKGITDRRPFRWA